MTNKLIKKNAKSALKADRWMPVLVTLLYSLIVSYVPFFLSSSLSIGVFNYYTKSLKGENKRFEDMFSGFKLYGKALLTHFLVILYQLLWFMIPIAGPIILIIKSYSYSLSLLILKDNPNLTANEAITKSREMMKGYKWKKFALMFSFIWWTILDILTLGLLGILYLAPYKQFSIIAFYEDLKK